MMTEHPIIFNTQMVKAILEGHKTMTRRLNGLRALNENPSDAQFQRVIQYQGNTIAQFRIPSINSPYDVKCPYGQVGDRLWVRETWQVDDWNYPNHPEAVLKENIEYRADALTEEEYFHYKGWRPSIHMPRWASRITLEITEVRVERLQEITEADAEAEGAVCRWNKGEPFWEQAMKYAQIPHEADWANASVNSTYKLGFRFLWDDLNAKRGYGWDTNCWVWVIGFKVVTPELLEGGN
jgi:hypothetical protein